MTIKHDHGKPEWHLIPWEALTEIVKVLTFGAKKYAPDNWKTVPNARERYVSALLRHVAAAASGEIRDPETGLLHWAHAGCCILFLIWFEMNPRSHED